MARNLNMIGRQEKIFRTTNRKLKRGIFMPFFILIVLTTYFISGCSSKEDLTKYVDPFIGTDAGGHTFPGACLPFGMVQLSPDNGYKGVKAYGYQEEKIIGFSHTHLSGTGPFTKTHYNNFLLMPRTGDLEIKPGVEKELDDLTENRWLEILDKMSEKEKEDWEKFTDAERIARKEEILLRERIEIFDGKDREEEGYFSDPSYRGYESSYSHDEEEASPGYYSVMLKDYNVQAELTCTQRVGFHCYTFPQSESAHIILDISHSLTPGRESYVEFLSDTEIQGHVLGDMEGSYDLPLKCYFHAVFSKPFDSFGTWHDEQVEHLSENREGKNGVGAYVNFQTKEGEQILVKVGISFVSMEGARNNMKTELNHWDFDQTREEARQIWNKKLQKITASGGSQDQKMIFYTALYHSLLFPRTFSDADGRYYSHFDDKIHKMDQGDYYVDFSLWDTYRALHPLMAYLEPEKQNDMIQTFLTMYEQGGRLPLHVSYKNHYQATMIGDHATSVIVDSYKKGIRDYDIEKAYDAMLKNAMVPGDRPSSRYGLKYYKDLEYLPAELVRESVSVTLEDAYDDWCLYEMAKDLGKAEDARLFKERAGYYKHLYDRETGFFRPRKADGSWLEMCDELPHVAYTDGHPYYSCFDPLWVGISPNRHYTESSAWQYLWHVPYDVEGLMNLMGGKDEFANRLNSLFTMSPKESGDVQYAPLRSKIGQYVHGNEPVHHVAYLFNYAGKPWLTQKWVNQVQTRMYGTGPDGLCGNDDMGQMSAWYIFSSMGFYPVAPGQNVYVIGTPMFEQIDLNLGEFFDNKTFTVKAEGISKENIYIQSATLNGRPFEKSWLHHNEIVGGGELVFQMGPDPNKKWAVGIDGIPPSLTPGK